MPASSVEYSAQTTSSDASNDRIAYLFLCEDAANWGPLAEVWRSYFATCEPGSYSVHVHSQNGTVPPYDVDTVTEHPVQGELRYSYRMQQAMFALYHDARAWEDEGNSSRASMSLMLSHDAAPLKACREVHAALLSGPRDISQLGLHEVDANDAEAAKRQPPGWRNALYPGIWLKATQWVALSAHDMAMLLEQEEAQLHVWNGSLCPDEHYTPNVLSSLGSHSYAPNNEVNRLHASHSPTHLLGFGPGGHAMSTSCPGGRTLRVARRAAEANVAVLAGADAGDSLRQFDAVLADATNLGQSFARKFDASCKSLLLSNIAEQEAEYRQRMAARDLREREQRKDTDAKPREELRAVVGRQSA